MRFLPSGLLLAILVSASPVLASYDSPPPPPPPPNSGGQMDSPEQPEASETPRQQAESYFRDGYDEVVKGTKDLEAGKAKNGNKHFKRALERCRHAVELDSTYSEAWNLVGFTSRKLGDYPRSFEAYQVALRQKPDFAQAREYYGEGLLETGDLAGALEQLGWLKRIGDAKLTAELEQAIASYRAAHPEPAAADSALAHSPAADSTAAGGR